MSDANGDHMVETYSSIGLVMTLCVASIVSFCFPHVVDMSALSICIVCLAWFCRCNFNVSLGSKVSPSSCELMSNATVIVRYGDLFWLKPVVMVLYCSACIVVALQAMLCGDMWDIVCDVWE